MHRMSRLTLFLAAAALAAAPSSLRAQPGGTTPSAQPSRPVDECGKPGPTRARPRRNAPATGSAAPARPPRLLGTPAGETAAGSGTASETGGSAASASHATAGGSDAHAGGTGAVAGSHSSATAGGSDAHAGGGGAAATGSHSSAAAGGGDVQGSTAAGTAGEGRQGAYSGTSAGGTTTQASGTSVEAAASSTSAGSQFLSADGDPRDGPIDPRAARRNRDALRLGLSGRGDRLRLGPAASVSVPTAFGVDGGELFVGVGYQARTRFTEDDDGAAVIGFGIGTRRVVALETALTSYSTLRSDPLETGGVSFKLHRALPGGTSVAVGWENAILWGGSDDDGSVYGVVTKVVTLRDDPEAPLNTAVLTLGLGNGRFRFEDDDAAGKETVNLFAAAGARITPQVSLVADWTGQDLNAAASFTPLLRVPVVITAGLADLTGLAGDGARFILSLGYGLAFRTPSF